MPAGIGDVASTSYITLYCHALETLSDNPILSDPKSVEITTELNKTLSRSDRTLDRILVSGTLDRRLIVHIAIRAKKYDDYARNFLERFPDGIIVNIGCGLDSRFLRIDNGCVVFYDLDLPEIPAIKKVFFTTTESPSAQRAVPVHGRRCVHVPGGEGCPIPCTENPGNVPGLRTGQ